jgi:hypothetical protein
VRSRRVYGAALAAAALLLFFYIVRFHEFWRDETHPALIARAVPLADSLQMMRREAVPAIVYLVLKVLGVLPPPYSLGALGALGFASLLLGTYQLLLTITGSPARSALATGAFALTDTYFYELGVVVRQYGLGLGFALACVAYLGRAIVSDERRDARWGAALGALAVSTSVHPGCLAGSALLAYSVERLVRKRTVRAVVEPLCALPAFLFTFFLITSYDRTPEMVAVFHRTFAQALAVAWACLLDGALCRGWWTPENIDPLKHGVIGLAGAGLVVLVLGRIPAIRRRPGLAAFYAAVFILNTLTLSYIFVVRYEGFYRHHLFIFVPVMVTGVGLLLSPVAKRESSRASPFTVAALLLPWFLFEYWACGTDLLGDLRGAFSGTKAAAAALPPGARVVVAGQDWVAVGILYWRPDVSMRARSGKGRSVRYVVADWDWHREVALRPLLVEECRKATEIYLVAPLSSPPPDTRCADVMLTPSSLLSTERFSIFDLHCACLGGLDADGTNSE